mgnify:CR=1 FL=1
MEGLFTGTTQSGLVIENGVVKSGRNCEGRIEVPEGTVGIGAQAFYQNKKLTGLKLPQGLKRIGKYAVNGCVDLEYIEVPESVEELEEGALVKKLDVVETKEYYPQIRCVEGSFTDKAILEMKKKDGWDKSHSNEHIVDLVYIR